MSKKDSYFMRQCEKLWNSKNFQSIIEFSDTEGKGYDYKPDKRCIVREEDRDIEKFKEGSRLYAEWLRETYGPKAKKKK